MYFSCRNARYLGAVFAYVIITFGRFLAHQIVIEVQCFDHLHVSGRNNWKEPYAGISGLGNTSEDGDGIYEDAGAESV